MKDIHPVNLITISHVLVQHNGLKKTLYFHEQHKFIKYQMHP